MRVRNVPCPSYPINWSHCTHECGSLSAVNAGQARITYLPIPAARYLTRPASAVALPHRITSLFGKCPSWAAELMKLGYQYYVDKVCVEHPALDVRRFLTRDYGEGHVGRVGHVIPAKPRTSRSSCRYSWRESIRNALP